MLDDMYHVLNSVYCAVYATTEEKQEQYARFLLTADTKVAVYDRKTPADRWIESLC